MRSVVQAFCESLYLLAVYVLIDRLSLDDWINLAKTCYYKQTVRCICWTHNNAYQIFRCTEHSPSMPACWPIPVSHVTEHLKVPVPDTRDGTGVGFVLAVNHSEIQATLKERKNNNVGINNT